MSFFHAVRSDGAKGSYKYCMIGLSMRSLIKYSIIWSLSNGVFGFYSSYFFVSVENNVSAAHDKPIEKLSFVPVLLIASSTIFRLSMMVSAGQMKVPSGDNFKAAYPPFPLTIPFFIA